MNEYPRFPNRDPAEEKAAPLGYPTVATRVAAPCPGSIENTVVLLRGSEVLDGLKKLKNVGSYLIHLLCFDGKGTFIGTFHFEPGEEMSFLTFPSNTEVVRLGCAKGMRRNGDSGIPNAVYRLVGAALETENRRRRLPPSHKVGFLASTLAI